MSYLTNKDFSLLIQDVNLQQIINENEAIRQQAELTAIGEARSYLIQKYLFDEELAKTGNARDPQLLNYIIDIALYHLHSRISPRNIPELRITRYDNAIAWLKMCALGEVTPKLEIQPTTGRMIQWGSNERNTNIY
jgi:phage gp36-like protein